MWELILIVVLVGAGMVFWRMRAGWLEEKLRKNPPERRVIEVSLPVGESASPAQMARFYRKVSTAAQGDEGARKIGARQIDFVYLADVVQEGAPPRMRCFIYADKDMMDKVKRALKSTFRSAVDVVEVPDDELRDIALRIRPPEEKAEGPAEEKKQDGQEE